MFLEHPYLYTLSTRSYQIAASDWLPQNLRWWIFVGELLDFDQLFSGERLLRLFIWGCSCFCESEYFYLVAMSIHYHASYCNCNIIVVLMLEANWIYPMLKVDVVYAFIWCFEQLAPLLLIRTKVTCNRTWEGRGSILLSTCKLLLLLLLNCLICGLRNMKMGLERILDILLLLILLLLELLRILLHESGSSCILLLSLWLLLGRCGLLLL